MTNPKDSFRQALDDDDGEFPESWIPKVGDALTGVVLRYTSGPTDYGPCPIVVLHDDATDAPRSFWLLHTVARNKFSELKPRVGERVGIKRVADDAKKGYHRFVVRVDRAVGDAEVPDFSTFAAPGDVAPDDRAALDAAPIAPPGPAPSGSGTSESFEDFPKALDDDVDDDLPF